MDISIRQQLGFALRKYFMPGCVGRVLDLDSRIRPRATASDMFLFNPQCVLAGIWRMRPWQLRDVSKLYFWWKFEKWDPDKDGIWKNPNSYSLRDSHKWDPGILQQSFQKYNMDPFRMSAYYIKRPRDVPSGKIRTANYSFVGSMLRFGQKWTPPSWKSNWVGC